MRGMLCLRYAWGWWGQWTPTTRWVYDGCVVVVVVAGITLDHDVTLYKDLMHMVCT